MKVEGLDEAIDGINREIGKIENLANEGLWEAGLKLMRQMQIRLKDSVVTGNLRASGYVRNATSFDRPEGSALDASKNAADPTDKVPDLGVELGFTANYALFVHENMAGRSPKFAEAVITENVNEVIDIVRKRSGGE